MCIQTTYSIMVQNALNFFFKSVLAKCMFNVLTKTFIEHVKIFCVVHIEHLFIVGQVKLRVIGLNLSHRLI